MIGLNYEIFVYFINKQLPITFKYILIIKYIQIISWVLIKYNSYKMENGSDNDQEK
jgi:hypothetical protein